MRLINEATAAEFNIVRQLGSGQIGELYIAQHPRLPRQYALKIVSADLSADPEYRFRFKQESDHAAMLWHPNIAGVQDRGELEDRLWLSMDYVDGVEAAQLLIDTYPEGMPPDMVVEIVAAIADALDYAHELGLAHRYVNPSNILLSNWESRRRRIVLTGFGLARRPGETNTLTRANLGIGTVSYTAPEQLMDDSIDGRTDQYGLACTAFHLLTGSPPFAHMNPAVLVGKHLNESPPQPGDVRPELTYFDTPFDTALQKNPAERFRRCRDFAKALESKEGLGPYSPNAGAAALLSPPDTNGTAPAPAPAPSLPVPHEPDPPTVAQADPPTERFDDVVAPTEVLPETEAEADDPLDPPDVLPEYDFDDDVELEEPDVRRAAKNDAGRPSHRRRQLQTAALGLAILTVTVGGIFAVIALRSASESHDGPSDVETSTSVTPEITFPTEVSTPAVLPPPSVRAPAPVATPPPSPIPSQATPPVASSTAPPTTAAQTTKTHSPPPTTTTSKGALDTRPAVGMPCGSPGAAATSNSGGPVVCSETPGGSAWEPPGG
jgi:serine/threonine protein kinase, bacterial